MLNSHGIAANSHIKEGRVVFVTGGAGTICSAQTRALVALGANACIIGRNQQKTEAAAIDIATARKGAKVIGIGACDVRNVRCCYSFHVCRGLAIANSKVAGESEKCRGKMREGTWGY